MNKTLKSINAVYYIVYMLTIIMAVAIFALSYLNVSRVYIDEKSPLGITLSSILTFYLLISIPLTFWMFHKGTKKWQNIPDQFEKFRAYKNGSILRLWLIGVGLILGVLMVYLFSSINMLYYAGISAIAFFFCKPTENKMIKELNLSDEEIE